MIKRTYLKKKKYRLRKRKPFYRKKFFWFGTLILLFLSGAFYLAIFFPGFQIKQIQVIGAKEISSEEIQNLAQDYIARDFLFFSSKSIFFANTKEIKQVLLQRFLLIANVNLKRKFPNKLVVEVEERKPVAIFCQQDSQQNSEFVRKCFFMDKKGVIFEELLEEIEENKNNYLIIINLGFKEGLLGREVIKREILNKSLEIREHLKEKMTYIVQAKEDKLIVRTIEGWEIYFSSRDDISRQIFNLSVVLEEKFPEQKRKNLEYIDLRFGNRIFYKFTEN